MNLSKPGQSPNLASKSNSMAPRQQEIRGRLRDYEAGDATAERERLVSQWRKHHPESVAESPSYLRPLIPVEGWRPTGKADDPQEVWHNDQYTVTLRRRTKDLVFGSDGGMIQLGICSHDGTARHDWRDFQAIKNQLAGPECEAFELYPAESRLLDPSNYYTLWCFPGVKRIKVGGDFRYVLDAPEALAPQRAIGSEPGRDEQKDGGAE